MALRFTSAPVEAERNTSPTPRALAAAGVTGVNYRLSVSSELLERVADAVVAGRIVPPPIADIKLDDAPAVLAGNGHADGKTVITL